MLGRNNIDHLHKSSESLTLSTKDGNLRPQSEDRLRHGVNHAFNSLSENIRAYIASYCRNIETITDEVDRRVSCESDVLMSSMNSRIQRAKNEAINGKVIPQI